MDLIINNISRYVQEEYANIFGFDIGCHEAIIICHECFSDHVYSMEQIVFVIKC